MNRRSVDQYITVSLLCVVIYALTAVRAFGQQVKPPDKWTSMQFLLGDWVGEGAGAPGQGSGGTTFTYDLMKTVLVRKNFANYPATKDRPAFSHEDLMVVYMENDKPNAMYFDNEGHVIRYLITTKTDTVTFLSEESASAPQFRLIYTKQAADTLRLSFDIAPVNRPGEFARYVEARIKRKK